MSKGNGDDPVVTREKTGWQQGKNLPQSLLYMHENELGCDVTFSVKLGEGLEERVYGHRLVLAARSAVLERMWAGGGAEPVTVEITDMPVSAVKDMVSCMYTDDVKVTDENLANLVPLAQRYQLDKLQQKCEAYVRGKISDVTVCGLLDRVLNLPDIDPVLAELCLNYITLNILAISFKESTSGFWELSDQAFGRIVSRDDLGVISETQVVDMCLEWVKQKLTRAGMVPYTYQQARAVLGQTFYQIRYTAMSPETFEENKARSLLTEQEQAVISAYITNQGSESDVKHLEESGFSLKPRSTKARQLNRFKRISSKCEFQFTGDEEFSIIPSRRVQFGGILLIRGPRGSKFEVTIKITDCSMKQTLHNYVATVTWPDCDITEYVPVYVKRLVELEKGKKYKFVISEEYKFVINEGMGSKTGYGEFTGLTDKFFTTTVGGMKFQVLQIPVEKGRSKEKQSVGRCPGIIFFPLP